MQLYVAIRGIKHELDQFITELQGKYLPMKWREKEGDPWQDMQVQLAVRPIQLYEFAYPKEQHDLVCATILGKPYGIMGNNGKEPTEHKWMKKFIFMFRKLLHLDPIPPYDYRRFLPVTRRNLTIIGLGTKQDYTMPNGVEGL